MRVNALNNHQAFSWYQLHRGRHLASSNAVHEAIDAQRRALETSSREAYRGLDDTRSQLRTGDGALQTQTLIAQRIQELAIQGSNAGLPSVARQAISGELKALQEEFGRVTQTKGLGNQDLLKGGTLQSLHSASGTPVDYALPDLTTSASSLSGIEDQSPNDVLDTARAALNNVTTARASLGAQENLLSRASSNLETSIEHLMQADARSGNNATESVLERTRREMRAALMTFSRG